MEQLTERENDILCFILAYRAKFGFSPSMRDICNGCYLASTRSAAIYIDNLTAKGYIRFTPKISRSIIVLEKGTA